MVISGGEAAFEAGEFGGRMAGRRGWRLMNTVDNSFVESEALRTPFGGIQGATQRMSAIDAHFYDILVLEFEKAGCGPFGGFFWRSQRWPGTQFHPDGRCVSFGRDSHLSLRVPAEEVQHALNFTRGGTLGNILKGAEREGIAAEHLNH